MLQVGVGAIKGVFKIGLRGAGWALVPRTWPRPPLLTSGSPVAPGAYWTLGWGGGGEAGEDRGIVGPPSIPPSLGTPRKNSAKGRGVEGGVISSHYQTRPYPSLFPSLALTRARKGQWLGWERGRGRGGGNTSTSSSERDGFKDRRLCFRIFFSLENLPFFSRFLLTTGRNAADFFCRLFLLTFPLKNRAKCCPFFSKNVFWPFDLQKKIRTIRFI